MKFTSREPWREVSDTYVLCILLRLLVPRLLLDVSTGRYGTYVRMLVHISPILQYPSKGRESDITFLV